MNGIGLNHSTHSLQRIELSVVSAVTKMLTEHYWPEDRVYQMVLNCVRMSVRSIIKQDIKSFFSTFCENSFGKAFKGLNVLVWVFWLFFFSKRCKDEIT